MRALEEGAAVFDVFPALRGKGERRDLDEVRSPLRMARGERLVLLRHPASGKDLGGFFQTAAKTRKPAEPGAKEPPPLLEERCAILTLEEVRTGAGATAPKAGGP